MRWRKPNLRSSLFALLGQEPAASVPDTRQCAGAIRQAMLQALADADPAQSGALLRRVAATADLRDLWYLRSDLMATLACSLGEQPARERLDAITAMFRGLLPEARPTRVPDLAH